MKKIEVYEVESRNTKITIASDRITIKIAKKDMDKADWKDIAQQLSGLTFEKTLRCFVRFNPIGFEGILRDNSKNSLFKLFYYNVFQIVTISELSKKEEEDYE